jgi:pilus assembly protein Flp/PilA
MHINTEGEQKRMLNIYAKALGLYAAARDRMAREEGQALVEYALILALIAVVTIAVLQAIGVNVSTILNKVSTSLSSVAGP